MSGGEFELIYEGPADDSADTLRRIKKTLVGELSFSIEETKEFLEKTPATLFTAEDEHSLDEYYHILRKAGARVYVVRPREAKKSNESEFEISLDFEEEKKQTKVFDVSEEAILEENFPIYEPIEEEHCEVSKDSKAFVISDEEASLENLISGLSEEENEYILPNVKEEAIEPKEVAKIESVSETTKENGIENPFTFDESTDLKVEVKKEEVKELPEVKEEKQELEKLDFSFDLNPAPPIVKQPEEPTKKSTPENSSGFDLSFVDDTPAPVQEPDNVVEEEVKPTQKWDLSLDIPNSAVSEPAAEQAKAVETKKTQEVDDILNDYNPNEESDESKREEVVIPPLAEVLSSKKTSAPTEAKAAPKTSPNEVTSNQGTRDIYYIALAATILLWIGNHWYFTSVKHEPAPAEQIESVKPKKKPKVEVAAPEKTMLIGTLKDEFGEVEVSVMEQQGKLLQVSISFKGIESAPLSPEQIVNGYKKRPWIEQIRFDPAGIETDIDGTIKVSGPARISINDDSQVKRLIGTGDLKAKLSGTSLSVKFDALYGTKQLNPGALVKRSENGLIVSVSIDTTIALNPKSS